MKTLSDDEFDHVKDFDVSETESETESVNQDTPSTTPPRTQTPRPPKRKVLHCPYEGCQKTFNRNARLQEHIRSHTNERPFTCPEPNCYKAFLRDTHLKHHLKSAHSDIRDYKCTWAGCEKSFATGTRLRRHVQAHEGKEKFRCRGYEDCNETFRKHETLRKHIITVHEHKKPFPCTHVNSKTGQECSQAFETSDKLKSHQRAMHDETRYCCNECLTRLTNAMQMEQPYTEHNDLYFSNFSDLQAHIAAVHPPTCPNCPTSFATKKELERHLEIQHGYIDPNKAVAKTFICDHAGCKQSFTKKGNLNVHVKTVHEKQKSFVCGRTEITVPEEFLGAFVEVHGCGRSFTSKASLEEHVRTAHFQLPSRRTQREYKRKAETTMENEDQQPKTRKPRRDKGKKKTSLLSGLTGIHINQPSTSHDQTNELTADLTAIDSFVKQEPLEHDIDVDAHSDDWNQLSGSMTMCGDHLYHNGRGYQYFSEGSGSASIGESLTLDQSGQYIPCSTTALPDDFLADEVETEPFFDYEHEQELVRNVIDPALMHQEA